MSDWANAWKNPIPKSYVDEAGIEITFSNEDIESIKAQLAIKNFKEIIDLESFTSLIKNDETMFLDIANNLNIMNQNFEFEFTLDDFAKSFGNTYGLDINNYADLTDASCTHTAVRGVPQSSWHQQVVASLYHRILRCSGGVQSSRLLWRLPQLQGANMALATL